jgi:hypothetical protein
MKMIKTLLLTTLLVSSFVGCAHKHDHHGKKKCDMKQCKLKNGKKSCCAGKKS